MAISSQNTELRHRSVNCETQHSPVCHLPGTGQLPSPELGEKRGIYEGIKERAGSNRMLPKKKIQLVLAFCKSHLVLRDAQTPRAGARYQDELSQLEVSLQATHMLDWRGDVESGKEMRTTAWSMR